MIVINESDLKLVGLVQHLTLSRMLYIKVVFHKITISADRVTAAGIFSDLIVSEIYALMWSTNKFIVRRFGHIDKIFLAFTLLNMIVFSNMYKRTLILAQDYQPVGFFPLSTIGWQHSIRLFFLDKITVLEWHDEVVHSAKLTMRIPAVAVARGQRRTNPLKYSRQNLYLRDLYKCQYCDDIFDSAELTIDHVVPRSQGGKTTWENTVTACKPCNWNKGSKIWRPNRAPVKPDYWRMVDNRRKLSVVIDHPSWREYLGIQEPTKTGS